MQVDRHKSTNTQRAFAYSILTSQSANKLLDQGSTRSIIFGSIHAPKCCIFAQLQNTMLLCDVLTTKQRNKSIAHRHSIYNLLG